MNFIDCENEGCKEGFSNATREYSLLLHFYVMDARDPGFFFKSCCYSIYFTDILSILGNWQKRYLMREFHERKESESEKSNEYFGDIILLKKRY